MTGLPLIIAFVAAIVIMIIMVVFVAMVMVVVPFCKLDRFNAVGCADSFEVVLFYRMESIFKPRLHIEPVIYNRFCLR